MKTCTTCGNRVDMPYRRTVAGKITEGCIDPCHKAHIVKPSTSYDWHVSGQKSLRNIRLNQSQS